MIFLKENFRRLAFLDVRSSWPELGGGCSEPANTIEANSAERFAIWIRQFAVEEFCE